MVVFLLVAILLPAVTLAGTPGLPECHLDIHFDINNSRVIGTAVIHTNIHATKELDSRLHGNDIFRANDSKDALFELPQDIINAKSKDKTDAAFRKISRYGRYSAVSFDNGRNVYKKTEEATRGMEIRLGEHLSAIDVFTFRRLSLSDVIEDVSDKRIIYVGEFHNRFAHHDVQLQVIKGLSRKNRMIAIGMEMFQRPFQMVLNDYIAGKIDEREFLKKSEYFKRWGLDYNLYKPILNFAKAEGITVIALNIREEIVKKVSRGGIDSLSEDEKREIPAEMDFSDNEYRERLREVFQRHENWKEKNFDFFYQAQILWDETMAMSIDDFLKKNPDYQMIVLAGAGHLKYGSGIPTRAFRRNGYSYAIILSDVEIEKGIAHYVLSPSPIDGPTAPGLTVSLMEKDGKVKIEGFPENSISEKAGLRVGDVILSLDGIAVNSIEDVRIHLFYKKRGDTVKVKVLRGGFIPGEREMEFDMTL